MMGTRSIRETDTDTHIISRKAAIEILFFNGGLYRTLGLLWLRWVADSLPRGSIRPRIRSAGTSLVDVQVPHLHSIRQLVLGVRRSIRVRSCSEPHRSVPTSDAPRVDTRRGSPLAT